MQNKHNVRNISEHPSKQRPQTPVVEVDIYRLLQRARLAAGTPVNICINGEQLLSIRQLSLSPSILLSSEIKLWAEVIGHRAVDNFLFSFPFQSLKPFELTQILHTLATCFNVPQCPARTHRVVSNLDEINTEHVALLKGLGFNHYQLVVATSDIDKPQRLTSVVKLIRRFSFQGISLLIRQTGNLSNLRAQILQLQQQVAPDFIYIGHHPKLLDRNSCYPDAILFDGDTEPLNNSLGLGPEGISRFCDTPLQNYCKAETYTNALKQNKLPLRPFHTGY